MKRSVSGEAESHLFGEDLERRIDVLAPIDEGAAVVIVANIGPQPLVARQRPEHKTVRQRIANVECAAQAFIDGVVVRRIVADDEGIGGNVGGIRAAAEKVASGNGPAGHHAERVAVIVEIVVVDLGLDLEFVEGLPKNADSHAVVVARADGLRITLCHRGVEPDREEAVAVDVVECDAQRQRIADERKIDGALGIELVVVAVAGFDVAAIAACGIGIARVDEDGAAGRVLAGEGALRTAQNLYRADVVIGFVGRKSRDCADAVAVDGYRRRGVAGVVFLADAANVDLVALAVVRDGERRGGELEVVDALHFVFLEVVGRHHGRRHGRALKLFISPLGGDNDGLDGARLIRWRGSRSRCKAQLANHNDDERRQAQFVRSHIPLRSLLYSNILLTCL